MPTLLSRLLHHLPHPRTVLPSLLPSLNPLSAEPGRARRLALLLTLLLCTLEFLFLSLVFALKAPLLLIPGMVFMLGLTALVLWNLHLVVVARGERRVCGAVVFGDGAVFGAFLWGVVAVHVLLVGLEITGLSGFVEGTRGMWGVVVAVVVGVAWVADGGEVEGGLSLA